jgi:uncharacterized membrane protein
VNPLFWSRVHGGATHFPIALIFGAALFDALGFVAWKSARRSGFQVAGYWLILLGGLSSFAAVFSGLILNQWKVIGTGLLREHHFFVWPAFALTMALAGWRAAAGQKPSRRASAIYLSFLAITCALMGAAGWSGGELIGR